MLKAAIIPVTPFQQNCALLWDEGTLRGSVIDPGGEVDRILAAIGELKLSVDSILLTHGHMDHAGGAAELKAALPGAPPVIGPDRRDAFLLEDLESQGGRFGMAARNIVPDQWLAEGDTVSIGGEEFDVLH